LSLALQMIDLLRYLELLRYGLYFTRTLPQRSPNSPSW
jgi:hypothetical protein